MTDINILKILKNLKIKNCEGFDRIPLRILNEGAEKLVKPLATEYLNSLITNSILTDKRNSQNNSKNMWSFKNDLNVLLLRPQ